MKVITNHVMVEEPVLREQKTENGFIMPEEKKGWEDVSHAAITSVGKDVKEVNVGDVVYYKAHSGVTIKTDEIVYRILAEEDILAVD